MQACEEYLSEMENSVPDYAFRKVLRDRVHRMTEAGRRWLTESETL